MSSVIQTPEALWLLASVILALLLSVCVIKAKLKTKLLIVLIPSFIYLVLLCLVQGMYFWHVMFYTSCFHFIAFVFVFIKVNIKIQALILIVFVISVLTYCERRSERRAIIKEKINKVCEQAGVFVFETVDIDKRYLKPVDKSKVLKGNVIALMVDDDYMLDLEAIEGVYRLDFNACKPIKSLQTWSSCLSEITRISDGKLLGYTYGARGFSTDKRGLSQGNGDLWCPKEVEGESESYGHSLLYRILVKHIFNLKTEEGVNHEH